MPHKHTRREQDLSLYDLPPTRIARPLPTAPAPKKKARNTTSTTKTRKDAKDAPKTKEVGKDGAKAKDVKDVKDKTATPAADGAPPKPKAKDDPRNLKRKRDAAAAAARANKGSVAAVAAKSNDTPRAFRRLMAMAGGKRTRSGLDNGVVAETKRQKKERRAKEVAMASAAAAAEAGVEGVELQALEEAAASEETVASEEKLKIQPGEKLADFNRRVDAALPLAGIVKNALPNSSGSKDPLGLAKTFRTKQERKLHKLYDQWRVDEAKLQEQREEAREEFDEEDAALDEEFGSKWREQTSTNKKVKRNKGGSGSNWAGDDIWGAFNRRRVKEDKHKAVRAGVHNSAEAPPEKLTAIDSSKFNFASKKAKDGKGKGSVEVAAAASL